MAAHIVLRDSQGLHLKAWVGRSRLFRIVLAENSQGSVTGNVSSERAALGPLETQGDWERLLAWQVPHMSASLRRLIAAAVVVSFRDPALWT